KVVGQPGTQPTVAVTTPVPTRRRQAPIRDSRSGLVAPHLAAIPGPLVIVPPDEREAFARFLLTVGKRPAVAASLTRPKVAEAEEPATAEPIVIASLEVKPLNPPAESTEENDK